MAYTVLARRYRSGTFDEVIGQDHVSQTLKKAIASDRIAHAFLFTGTRGVGKTSMARILAKALNCLGSDKATTEPCGKCSSCEAVARGEDIDVIEIDAASNTGVDNVRDIIENARFRPARARFKVYIIDEVHMLSKAAFNALLKIMEEPPGHVKFILATTEAEKVLPTILSRCQRYDFRNIPPAEIVKHLRRICDDEKINAQDAALAMVARAGAGSMRDSLSVLDRLLSVGEKTLDVSTIEQVLGVPRAQAIFDLAEAIGRADVARTLTLANGIVDSGLGVDTLIASLIEHLHRLLVVRTCGIKSSLVDAVGFDSAELESQASRFEPALLTQDIAILEELRRQMRSSQASRAILDATLVRLALSEQFVDVDAVEAGGLPGDQKKKPELKSSVENRRPALVVPPQPTTSTPPPVAVTLPSTVAAPPASKAASILAQVSRDMPIDVPASTPPETRRPRAVRPDLEALARDVVDQPVGQVDDTLREDPLVKAVLDAFEGAKLVAD
jgi:DNA polymerase-3 subunit gamma/tau